MCAPLDSVSRFFLMKSPRFARSFHPHFQIVAALRNDDKLITNVLFASLSSSRGNEALPGARIECDEYSIFNERANDRPLEPLFLGADVGVLRLAASRAGRVE